MTVLQECQSPTGADVFPVTHAMVDPSSLGSELTAAYGFTGEVKCVLFRRGFHDTYILTAAGTRHIVRVYRASSSQSDVAYELHLLRHLASRGVSVSGPLDTRESGLACELNAPEGSRLAAVFSFAEGRALQWNASESWQAGRLLAEIHLHASDFSTLQTRPPLSLDRLVDDSLRAVTPYLQERADDLAFMRFVAGTLRSAVDRITPTLEWGVCHGDFNTGNIHVAGDRILTAFDFDFCGPGWRGYDLVGAWRWSEVLGRDIWTSFVDGYRSIRPLSEQDATAAPLFDGISRFRSLGLRATNAAYRGLQPVAGRKLARQLSFLRSWVSQHMDGV